MWSENKRAQQNTIRVWHNVNEETEKKNLHRTYLVAFLATELLVLATEWKAILCALPNPVQSKQIQQGQKRK